MRETRPVCTDLEATSRHDGDVVMLRIGPLSASGALEWIEYAQKTLGRFAGIFDELPFDVPPEVVLAFDTYLSSWEAAAQTEPFLWSREVEAFEIRHLMTYWLNIAHVLSDEATYRGAPRTSGAGAGFYESLVEALLGALAEEDQIGDRLHEAWPRADRPNPERDAI